MFSIHVFIYLTIKILYIFTNSYIYLYISPLIIHTNFGYPGLTMKLMVH